MDDLFRATLLFLVGGYVYVTLSLVPTQSAQLVAQWALTMSALSITLLLFRSFARAVVFLDELAERTFRSGDPHLEA